MSFIPTLNGYSLTDFHDFDECKFRFFVRHHLQKKYEIAKGSQQMALGVLLDRAIKEIHRNRINGAYSASLERLVKSIRYAAELIKKEEKLSKKRPNFNTAVIDFFTPQVVETAEGLFKNYYTQIGGRFKEAIFDVDFCKWYLKVGNEEYVLWGGPDTIEMGEDGIPEVIDYKSRQNIIRGKELMDRELMPKMYALLTAKQLQKLGYQKARFKVVFWQDPLDNSVMEEFDLASISEMEEIFIKRIAAILEHKQIDYCMGQYCDACNSDKREVFLQELLARGLILSLEDSTLITGALSAEVPIISTE